MHVGPHQPKVGTADASGNTDNYIQTATCNATWRQCTTTVQLTKSTILIIRTEEVCRSWGFVLPPPRDMWGPVSNLPLRSLSFVANEVTFVLLKSGLSFLHSIIVVSILLLVCGNICTIRLVFCFVCQHIHVGRPSWCCVKSRK